MNTILVVDGYNIIGAWPDLRILRDQDLAAARDRLIEMMAEYQGFSGHDVIIVFDAYYVQGTEKKFKNSKVDVIFTKENETANSIKGIVCLFGAIAGDIIGSRYEFFPHKDTNFPLFHNEYSDYTDDTVMTIANAYWLISDKSLFEIMQDYGKRYPTAGYGGMFKDWLKTNNPKPYNSFGNGSAMRVSPIGWFFNTMEEVLRFAKLSADVTHNHPEGIKGAVAVAGAIYLARTGSTMNEIKKYISRFYKINFTLDEIRPYYGFYETCQDSVPQAFEAFFESVSFEDAIRNAISIGGDSDTIAAITGSVAEAFYGVENKLKETAVSYLDERLLKIYNEFNNKAEVN